MKVRIRIFERYDHWNAENTPLYEEVRTYKDSSWGWAERRMHKLLAEYDTPYGILERLPKED